jgi:putative hydrolase of the HAD superfamily
MKKAIFFDLYGTLIDIRTDEHDPWVYSVLSQYLSYHSVNVTSEELKEAYFEKIEQHFEKSGEEYPEVDIQEIFNEIMHQYGIKRYDETVVSDTALLFRSLTMRHFGLFPSLADTLSRLYGDYRMAVIYDAQWIFAEPEIEMLGLDQFFGFIILSSRFGFKKPDVRLFDLAMKKLDVKPEESIYIGDAPQRDLVGAKRAGMKCILFRSECLEYSNLMADGCFFDYSVLENILNAIV